MATLHEPARDIPVIHEADVCVLGGSCTGLFAAVRAARLGARVAIVEKDNCFGGIATTALVNVWHSLWDTEGKRQIIAGLTGEVVDRLDRRGALWRNKITNPSIGFTFNSEELKIELDELAREAGLKIYVHT
jgi:flavin-dependent dehydrogenase